MSESGLCQYKDILGKPDEGLHSIRIFNIAIIDVLLTIAFAGAIYYLVGWIWGFNNKWISFWWILIGCFVLGIILHRLFCVRTTIDKLLFPRNS